MECLHRFCRDCIDKSMRLRYGIVFSTINCSILLQFWFKLDPYLYALFSIYILTKFTTF